MIYLLTTIHVIVCLFLVVVVLLQSGKAADLAGAFGGMGSQTAFGPARGLERRCCRRRRRSPRRCSW